MTKKQKDFLKVYQEFDEWLKSIDFVQSKFNTPADYHYSSYDEKINSMCGVECYENKMLKRTIRFIRDRNEHKIFFLPDQMVLTLEEFKAVFKELLLFELNQRQKQIAQIESYLK